MNDFKTRFLDWAVTQSAGLHRLTERMGTAENWLRGQAMLAALDGAFGPFDDVGGEIGKGRTDLTLYERGACRVRVELKLVYNNKNLLGHQNGAASVAYDVTKLRSVEADAKYVAVWCLFRNRHVGGDPTGYYHWQTADMRLHPLEHPSEQAYADFASGLATSALQRAGVRVGAPLTFNIEEGRWSGLFLHAVTDAAA